MVRVGVDRRLDAGDRGLVTERTAALVDMPLELGAVLPQIARHWVNREVAKRAERATQHPRADTLEQLQVALRAVTLFDARQQLHEPARALAARCALPARLVHIELRRAQRELHHAAAVVDHDDRRGAEERARRTNRVVVKRRVELVWCEDRNRRTARNDSLD